MHDIRLIRENPQGFDTALARRGVAPQSAAILALDQQLRAKKTKVESLNAANTATSKVIGGLIAQGKTDEAERAKANVIKLKAELPLEMEAQRVAEEELRTILTSLPNLPAHDVPQGEDEADNVEVSRWGTPREFDFPPREHADLGPPLGLDFETGALIAGARFTFLRGHMARLHRALAQFMLDRQTGENGYTECNPPLLVKDEAVFGTGQLPKFEDDLFYIPAVSYRDSVLQKFTAILGNAELLQRVLNADPEFLENLVETLDSPKLGGRWLIPTAEVSLTNSVLGQILSDSALPLRMTALTPCFRSEAGAAGRDTRGFIRQHQFEKVELVSITRPEDSDAEHERMTEAAESILQALGLPYRKMLLCSGDMGFTARKTYDLEVWLPGQNAYREISSCSNCGDFQARRMNARYRPENAKGTEFVHTLNGSGLAVGRTLVAVLENYQQGDGTVDVPEVLKPYMGGVSRLTPLG